MVEEKINLTSNDLAQRLDFTVRNDFSINSTVSFIYPKYRLTVGTSTPMGSYSPNSSGTKVAFIYLNLSYKQSFL